jgi:hypothetical protein
MKPAAALSARIEQARAACQEALAGDDLAGALAFLVRNGVPPERGVELLRATAEAERTAPELLQLRPAALSAYGSLEKAVVVERALLVLAALRTIDRIPGLPVDESVKRLFCKEFVSYARPPAGTSLRLDMTKSPFVSMSRVLFQIRFPGGLIDWERSGFIKRWVPKIPPRFLVPTLRFLAFEVGGFKPFLRTHMADGLLRPAFIRDKDVNLSFYRMAAAAELQPDIKALMAESWLVSAETRRVSPHLDCLAHPWLEAGAIYTETGPAVAGQGFLVGNENRGKLYESGKYKPAIGVFICTRAQAIAWKHAHGALGDRGQ